MTVKLVTALSLILVNTALFADESQAGWPTATGDAGGQHYSALNQINSTNVSQLKLAWQYHTGDVSTKVHTANPTTFETTPILVKQKLIFCTPFNRVIALDARSGNLQWLYDPHLNLSKKYSQGFLVCRGVAAGDDKIFTATQDGRLIALNAETGKPDVAFGQQGEVNLNANLARVTIPENQYQALGISNNLIAAVKNFVAVSYTSPPAIMNNKVIVGSSIADNFYQNIAHGVVRAYDIHSGKLLWSFDPIPVVAANQTGAANTWSPIATDPKNNLVFIATTSASVDYYGGQRLLPMPLTNAVVALNADNGKIVWSKQLVHHNIFDYDLPAQPTLASVTINGKKREVVIQATKMGFIYVLDRLTGEAIFPIIEKPVPVSDVPGEHAAATQPFPANSAFRLLNDRQLTSNNAWGLTALDRYSCERTIQQLRADGIFTPASVKGSVEFPFAGGGINWGGVAYDPATQTLVANSSALAQVIRLVPRAKADQIGYSAQTHGAGSALSPAWGSPYAMQRYPLLSPLGVPCNAPPWGSLTAINLGTGKRLWQIPFGSYKMRLGVHSPSAWGSPTIGGSLVTAGHLIFIASGMDARIHAYDLATGKALWQDDLPAIANAGPMTYQIDGKQYVVIAAGGGMGSPDYLRGDAILAYRLIK